jgi:hypothetical protein
MEQYSMSTTQQQSHIERQRTYTTPTQRSVDNPPFTNVLSAEPPTERPYVTTNDDENKLNFIPKPVLGILGSTYCFITLCILLVFPILHVAIGGAYIGQCPIQPYIPVYLIVTGSCGMASIVFTLAIVRYDFVFF